MMGINGINYGLFYSTQNVSLINESALENFSPQTKLRTYRIVWSKCLTIYDCTVPCMIG
jgi:hypothetical protein